MDFDLSFYYLLYAFQLVPLSQLAHFVCNISPMEFGPVHSAKTPLTNFILHCIILDGTGVQNGQRTVFGTRCPQRSFWDWMFTGRGWSLQCPLLKWDVGCCIEINSSCYYPLLHNINQLLWAILPTVPGLCCVMHRPCAILCFSSSFDLKLQLWGNDPCVVVRAAPLGDWWGTLFDVLRGCALTQSPMVGFSLRSQALAWTEAPRIEAPWTGAPEGEVPGAEIPGAKVPCGMLGIHLATSSVSGLMRASGNFKP